jgi:ribosome-associated protein
MKPEELRIRNFEDEFVFSASRSSGPGGQNVNKLNTRIELRFSIPNSRLLSEREKELLMDKLANKINNDGDLLLFAQSKRTQMMNKKEAADKFYNLISKALTPRTERISTKPTVASVNKRLDEKRSRGIKKRFRKISGENHDDAN